MARMPTRLLPVAGSLLLALAFLGGGCSGSESDPTYRIEAGNPEMEAAFAKGRATLSDFWKVLAHPTSGESDFSVKVPLRQNGRTEYFWIVDPTRGDGVVRGQIGNDPEFVKRVKLGETVEFKESEIVDWMYLRAGKMHGNYTLRPLMKSMDAKERAELEQVLAEP